MLRKRGDGKINVSFEEGVGVRNVENCKWEISFNERRGREGLRGNEKKRGGKTTWSGKDYMKTVYRKK